MTSDLVAWTLQVLDTVVEKDCREVAGLVLDNMLVEVASAIDHNLAIHGKVFPVVVGLVFVANGTPDAGLGDGMLVAALEDSCAHDLLDVCSGALDLVANESVFVLAATEFRVGNVKVTTEEKLWEFESLAGVGALEVPVLNEDLGGTTVGVALLAKDEAGEELLNESVVGGLLHVVAFQGHLDGLGLHAPIVLAVNIFEANNKDDDGRHCCGPEVELELIAGTLVVDFALHALEDFLFRLSQVSVVGTPIRDPGGD